MSGDFTRIQSLHLPCPICGKPDWCLIAGDPAAPHAVICPRTETGSVKYLGEAGYLHILGGRRPPSPPRRMAFARPHARKQNRIFEALAEAACRTAPRDARVAQLSHGLGVSRSSLETLGCGWLSAAQLRGHDTGCGTGPGCWTFPMHDAAGAVIGIRLRSVTGAKYAVRGSHTGVFIPAALARKPSRLWICEGPTDLAALIDMGQDAIARPSCTGGASYILQVVMRADPQSVAIIYDRDPGGSDADTFTRRGAERLSLALQRLRSRRSGGHRVYTLQPPEGCKDVRQWRRAGASADSLAQELVIQAGV